MINDDKTFYHKALVWSAFFVLGDKTTCYCLSSLRNISSPYFSPDIFFCKHKDIENHEEMIADFIK